MYPDFVCVVTLACIMPLCTCKAMHCYMGQQPDPNHGYELRWVLPYTKDVLCKCTYIISGGLNLEAPVGAENHFYPDNPMIFINNDNVEELRGLLGCDGAEPASKEGSTVEPTPVSREQDDTTVVTTDSQEGSTSKYDETTASNRHRTPNEGSSTIESSSGDSTDVEECSDPLGMEGENIPDGSIQASTVYSLKFTTYYAHAYYARLNGNKAWVAESSDEVPWIQADIGYQTNVTGVVTQGDGGDGDYDDWVKTLKVSTFLSSTSDPETFITGAAGGEYKEFEANTDIDTEVTIHFKEPVTVRIVRIYPLTRSSKYWSMRFEQLGCRIV